MNSQNKLWILEQFVMLCASVFLLLINESQCDVIK